MDKCPYCGLRMCGSQSGSDMCEPDLYRSGLYSPEEIEIFRSEWGESMAKQAEAHNTQLKEESR
jgi:hypothetical protein